MRRCLVAVILLNLPQQMLGQVELITNGDFEQYDHCPDLSGIWSINALHWTSPNTLSPDYYHLCAEPLINVNDTIWISGVPKNQAGIQPAHSGRAYMGLFCLQTPQTDEPREYVQAELAATCVAGSRYVVSFYLSAADHYRMAVSTVGAYLSSDPITAPIGVHRIDVSPQILPDPLMPLTDTVNWVLVTDTFVSPVGGERYITIGNFHSDALSDSVLYNPQPPFGNRDAYYYIDDVSVIALDSVSSVAEATQWRMAAWPNPATAAIELQWPVPLQQGAHLWLHDAQGRTVLQMALPAGSTKAQLHVAHLPPGLYLAEVRQAGGVLPMRERVIVVRE